MASSGSAIQFSTICESFGAQPINITADASQHEVGAAADGVLTEEQCRNVTRHSAAFLSLMRPAGMGKDGTAWSNKTARSDSLLWVTDLYDSWARGRQLPKGFEPIGAAAADLNPIFQAFQSARRALLDNSNATLELSEKISIQIACYPAGSSGYHEHVDAFPPEHSGANIRQVTLLMYLNDDWKVGDGGQLSLPGCTPSSIQPRGGRLLAFDSHRVRHAVLPTGPSRPRWALTCWLYGRGAFRGAHQLPSRAIIPPSFPAMVPADIPATHTHPAPELEAPLAEQHPRIFVNIPAFRDPQTRATVWDLLATAEHPERVFIGVVQQLNLACDGAGRAADAEFDVSADLHAVAAHYAAKGSNSASDTTGVPWGLQLSHAALQRALPYMNSRHVRVMTVPSLTAAGPCWARHLADSLWQGEEYTLYLDSHMRMPFKWDSSALAQLHAAELLAEPPMTSAHAGSVDTSADGPTLPSTPPAESLLHTIEHSASLPTADSHAGGPPLRLATGQRAVVLSAYPGGYNLPQTQADAGSSKAAIPPNYTYYVSRVGSSTPLRLSLDKFGGDGWPRIKGNYARVPPAYMRQATKMDASGTLRSVLRGAPPPMPGMWCAAGLAFARTATWHAVRDVCGAPALGDASMRHVFFGEEVLMALRIHRAGACVFAPGVPLAWHMWLRAGRRSFRHEAVDAAAATAAANQRARAQDAMREEIRVHAPAHLPVLCQCLHARSGADRDLGDSHDKPCAIGAGANAHAVTPVQSIAQAAAATVAADAWALPPQLLMLGKSMTVASAGATAAEAAAGDARTRSASE